MTILIFNLLSIAIVSGTYKSTDWMCILPIVFKIVIEAIAVAHRYHVVPASHMCCCQKE